MARRPNVQSDRDDWGAVLNDYLDVSLAEDGTIKDEAAAALPISDATQAALARTTPRVATPSGTEAAHPTLTKPLDAPILAFADQDAPTLYYPELVDMRPSGGEGVALLYSTDHDAGYGGIYKATAPHPLGPYTNQGLIYQDKTSSTAQTETPSVIWNEQTGLYHMYYHNVGVPPGVQSTILATSPDLVTFTKIGVTDPNFVGVEPGNGHNGYWKVFRVGAGWYAYSLYSDGDHGRRNAFWYSRDGFEWWPHPQKMGGFPDLLDHLDGSDVTWSAVWNNGGVLQWRGQWWWIGMAGPMTDAGGWDFEAGSPRVITAPLAPNLRALAARPVDITPPMQEWEGVYHNAPGGLLEWDGRVYMCYRGEGQTSGIGIWEVH